ncbi:ATP-binding protein [Caulobacter flavus]|nr:ATP-binding protein [Caulobacter flavus]
MVHNPLSLEARRLNAIHWIVGSAAVLVAVSILGALALMLLAARSLDHIETLDERALVERTVQRTLERMTRELTSATVWDDAYAATAGEVDAAWADVNFGDYYHRYFGHDLTFAVRRGAVIYASSEGARAPAARIEALRSATAPMIDEVAARAAAARRAGRINLEGVSTASGLFQAADGIYLVAASDVIVEHADLARTQPTEPVVVLTARRVDARFIQGMRGDLGVDGLALTTRARPSQPHVELRDRAGRRVGALAWPARDPGMSLLLRAAPWIGAMFLLLLAASLVLFVWLSRVVASLSAKRQALVVAKEQAEAANVAKTQFLANMSHEIRTPLNGVLGMTQIMALGELPPVQRERLAIVEESSRALLALLSNVLDMARLEAGAVGLREEVFVVEDLVEASCAIFSGAAASGGIALGWDVAEDARGRWRGDPMRLRQVFGNLVANAVKFTEVGSVRVSAARSARGLAFEIADTGVGVAASDLPRLFGTFSQLDDSSTRSHGGSGLGLAICRELVELMGGAISVDSAPGAGSTFRFDVPLTRA